MRRRIGISLLLIGLVFVIVWADEIDILQDEYWEFDIKIPPREYFTSVWSSIYFSPSEMNSTPATGNYMANVDFWLSMDLVRGYAGSPVVLSSSYRSPYWNSVWTDNQYSFHPYGTAADVWEVWGILWPDMSSWDKHHFIMICDSHGLEAYDKGNHCHVELEGSYCSFPGNYIPPPG